MITGINESKTLAKHILSEYKCNLMEESVIQIKSGITINVRVSEKKKKKKFVCSNKIIFGILLHVVLNIVNI